MVLERLSANVSGRLRRRDGAGVQVRARLLHRLGSRDFFLHCRKLPSASVIKSPEEIETKAQCSSAPPPTTATTPTTLFETSRLPDPSIRVSYTQALRSSSTTTTITEDNTNNTSKVQFQPTVSVVEIPPRHAYTLQQRKSLWRTPEEIRCLVRRNRQEFNADGRDWRRATEEEDMVELGNGTLVHPSTYRTRMAIRFRTGCKPKVHRKTQSYHKRGFVSAN